MTAQATSQVQQRNLKPAACWTTSVKSVTFGAVLSFPTLHTVQICGSFRLEMPSVVCLQRLPEKYQTAQKTLNAAQERI